MTHFNLSVSVVAICLGLSACGAESEPTTNATVSSGADNSSSDNSSSDNSSGDASGGTTSESLTVDAGLDQVTAQGKTVTLMADAGANSAATFVWEQIAGPTVALSDTSSSTPAFQAPSVGESTELVFEVTVSDGVNPEVRDTVSVEVWVPFDQSNNSALGDFSANDGWECNVDTGVPNNYAEDAQGLETSITSNGIPDGYAVGTFPNSGNPNSISAQSHMYSVPLEPEKTEVATDPRIFGISIDGILMERETAECYNNEQSCDWRYEAITPGVAANAGGTSWAGASGWIGTDCNNAHVQPTGNYHFHGLPEGLINKLGDDGGQMVKVGTAGDGFPIYARWGYADPNDASSAIVRIEASWELKPGTRPSGPGGTYSGIFLQDWEYVDGSGDLDECSGRFGVTPDYPDGIYHYYLTDDYPYIPRCFFGTASDSGFVGAPGR